MRRVAQFQPRRSAQQPRYLLLDRATAHPARASSLCARVARPFVAIQQVFGTPKACGIAIDYSGVFLAAAFSAGLIAKLIAM